MYTSFVLASHLHLNVDHAGSVSRSSQVSISVAAIAEMEFIMPELSTRVDSIHQQVDLLPWADPYIMQLFRESNLLENATEAVGSSEADDANVTPGGKATNEAVLTGQSWLIRPLNRSAEPRTRRTVSGHLMARC